jgi:hypothetical protein
MQALEADCQSRFSAAGVQAEAATQVRVSDLAQISDIEVQYIPLLGPNNEEGVSQANQWALTCSYRPGITAPYSVEVIPVSIDTPGGEGG